MDQDTLKREIKFRAWGRYGNWDDEGEKQDWEMIDADSLCFEEFKPLCDLLENKEDQEYFMQYTGLKDKNGVEIYEGDIIKWGKRPIEMEERIAEVKINPDIQFDCKNITYPHVFHWASFAYGSKDLEVIGNIYQTPELLTP